MPAPFGLLSTGFSLKTFDDIRLALEQRVQSIFGPVDVSASSQFGQLIAAFGEEVALIWQGQQDLWAAQDPRTNTGAALANSAALVGMTKLPATYTEVAVTFSGTNGTVIGTGVKVGILNGEVFETIATGTISGGSVSITCRAVNIGAVKAPAGSITILQTPVAGVASVTNPLDPTIDGQDEENDERFRERRTLVFAALGQASVTAIRSKILQVSNVTDTFVYENYTDVTDASGLPPHSFEVVVRGGANADIAQAIFDIRKLGIRAYGTTSVSINDSQGVAVPIGFSRPVDTNIYLTVDILVDKSLFPLDGSDLVKEAIVAKADATLHMGSEVYASAYIPAIYGVAGVVQVEMPDVGTAPAPSGAVVTLNNRQFPVFDTSRITVNVSYL